MTATSSFLVDDGLATGLPAGMRPWTLAPPVSVAFAPGSEGPPEGPVWRISLASDSALARTHLAETGCRFFNLNLGRSFLFGGPDPVLGTIRTGYLDVEG